MIICKECGQHNQDADSFCASCGAFLEWSGERVQSPPSSPAPAPPPRQPAPGPGPGPGIVERVKQAVGIEGGARPQEPPAQQEGAHSGDGQPARPVLGQEGATRPGAWGPPASIQGAPVESLPPRAPSPEVEPRPREVVPLAPQEPGAAPAAGAGELSARRPEAGTPTGPRPRPVPRPVPAAPDQFEAGDVVCPHCGMGNAATRHFCRRCGTGLGRVAVARPPWYRRLLPRRRLPAAGDRRAPPRDVSVGRFLRTFVLTVLAVLLSGALLAYVIAPPFRQTINLRAERLVTDVRLLLHPNLVEVRPTGARATSALAGHPVDAVADLVSDDYWSADTGRDRQPAVEFTFASPTDLDDLLVTSGAGADYARLARPRTIELTYSDGTSERVSLKDDRQPTGYAIHARKVTSATIRILDVYPVSGATAVAVAEIEFFHLT